MGSTDLPPELSADLAAHGGCVAGAASVDELEAMLRKAGFDEIRILSYHVLLICVALAEHAQGKSA